MTLLDFVVQMCESELNVQLLIESGFVPHFLQTSLEGGPLASSLVSHSFLVSVSRVYSLHPTTFQLPPSYFAFLGANMESSAEADKECALSSLSFSLRHKAGSLPAILGLPDLLRCWLACGKTTSEQLRFAFYESLKGLLAVESTQERDTYSNDVFLLASNVGAPSNHPMPGNLAKCVEDLMYYVDIPFTAMELKTLEVVRALLPWEWGYKTLFRETGKHLG